MLPSRKTLEAAFPGKGKELRELLEKKRKTRDYQSVRNWEIQCYNPPKYHERLMVALNEILDGYGVEVISEDTSNLEVHAEYINLGDTYTTTLLYDYTRQKWFVTSWGDWVEYQERQGIVYP